MWSEQLSNIACSQTVVVTEEGVAVTALVAFAATTVAAVLALVVAVEVEVSTAAAMDFLVELTAAVVVVLIAISY